MGAKIEAMPGAERDDESGRYQPTYPTEAFLKALEAEGGMAGTQDVAEHVECSYETAYKTLRALEDDDVVTSRKIANARLWQYSSDL